MKSLTVIQHTSADYLGLMEDHLEGRRIGFVYCRPFTEGVSVPKFESLRDGLVLLGGGPWGSAGRRDLPTLDEEVRLARMCLMTDKPVIGIGLGAQILALAADGETVDNPLTFCCSEAFRTSPDVLNTYLPDKYWNVTYMRDRPVPPDYAQILARDGNGQPALFQIGENAFGFTGHPGFKLAMAEDLIMEFEEAPPDPGPQLQRLRHLKTDIEDALVPIMTGLVQLTGMMRSD